MWFKFNEDSAYVVSKVNGSLCIEYCTEYHDEEDNVLFVPDSLHNNFKKEYPHEDFA